MVLAGIAQIPWFALFVHAASALPSKQSVISTRGFLHFYLSYSPHPTWGCERAAGRC